MGFLSFIKSIYYNNKLNKAIKLTTENNFSQAEASLTELITAHPEAATELAKMYLKQANEQYDFINYCQKALNCETKLVKGISNKSSYLAVKEEILKLNYNQFKRFYSENNSIKALDFSNLLLKYRKDETFIIEHFKCLFTYAISIANTDEENSNSILVQIYYDCKSKSFLSEILDNTINEIFKRAKEYSKLKKTQASNNLFEVIKDDKLEAKQLLINNYVENIELFKSKQFELQKLVKVICSIPDKGVRIKYLEKILSYSNEAKISYSKYVVEITNELIKSKKYLASIELLEHAISLFHENVFTDQLMLICERYIEEAEYNQPIALLNKLISKHPDAEPLLAKCFLKLSLKEKSNDSKKYWLLKAFEIKKNHSKLFNDKLYEPIFSDVVSNLINVAYKFGEFSYYTDSYSLLNLVIFYKPTALNTFIEVKLLEINSLTSIDKQIELLKKTIDDAKKKMTGILNINEIQLDILYIKLIDISLKKFINSDNDTTIKGLFDLKKEIKRQDYQSDSIVHSINKIDVAIADRYLKKGLEHEVHNQLKEALYCYESIKKDFKNVRETFELILVRTQIVLLKDILKFEKSINHDTINNILSNSKRTNVVIDLAYRYAIYLIKCKEINNAINIIEKYLPTKSNDVTLLKTFCNNAEIKIAKDLLENLNLKIDKINAEELSIKDAIQIISEIEAIETKCSVLIDVKGKIIDLKEKFIDYIIYKSFKEENYQETLLYLKKYKNNYITNNILFRNAAIASIGIIATGGMKEQNYKELISVWVTAVFNVKLFVDSLNYTKWDDKFTFSLQNALGSLNDDDMENIPDNVNYDDINNTNISISEVQKSLLDKIEYFVTQDFYNDKLKVVCLDFFHDEINAISLLFKLELEDQIFGCTPYFAQQNNKLLVQISKSLTNELQYCDNNCENVLKVGLLYNIRENQFKSYSDAIILKNKSIDVIRSKSESQIKLIFTSQNIGKVKSYDELYLELCNELREEFKIQIKDEKYFQKTITYFLNVCKAVSDPNLDYLVSNSANKICVTKLNEESISKSDGLKILLDVFVCIKNNDKLNENIQAIINAGVIDIILEDDRTLKSQLIKTIEITQGFFEKGIIETLSTALEVIIFSGKFDRLTMFVADFNTKGTFNGALNNVLTKAKVIQGNFELSNIIEQLNNNSISEIVGLERTVELYKRNKNHNRICENLVILSGNLIHSNVIQRTSSTSRVIRILDDLVNNRSTVFKNFAVQLSNQREDILNSLPFEVRRLMTGSSLPGQSLTPEGESLKKGLDYLKQLSN